MFGSDKRTDLLVHLKFVQKSLKILLHKPKQTVTSAHTPELRRLKMASGLAFVSENGGNNHIRQLFTYIVILISKHSNYSNFKVIF